MGQTHITKLEILAQNLQHCLRLYGKSLIEDDLDEKTLRPNQLWGFLQHEKDKDRFPQGYEYKGRYDDYYQDDNYYERYDNYDYNLRFNPKIDIPEFDGRMDVDDFLDWLNTMEYAFGYYESPEHKKVKLATIEMCKNTSIWWKNLNGECETNPMVVKSLIEDGFDEEALQPNRHWGFLQHKKAKDRFAWVYNCYDCKGDIMTTTRMIKTTRGSDKYDYELRFNLKVDIPEFVGRIDVDLLDWVNMLDYVFDYYDPPKHKTIKLVTIKICKNIAIWWKNLNR